MTNPAFPENYQQWRHCITEECGIPLTSEFVEQRLRVWRDESSQETKRYRKLYGDQYWKFMISCFERASKELGSAAT